MQNFLSLIDVFDYIFINYRVSPTQIGLYHDINDNLCRSVANYTFFYKLNIHVLGSVKNQEVIFTATTFFLHA